MVNATKFSKLEHFRYVFNFNYFVSELQPRMWLFCEGCIQVGQGAGWKHVLRMCRVGRDQEFIEMNVNIALHGSWCHRHCASQTVMDQQ